MINLKLEGKSGSEILRIQAAVLEVMERAEFHPSEINTELCEAQDKNNWLMVFVKEEVSTKDIGNVIRGLGSDFRMTIKGRSKANVFVCLEAPKDSFMRLIKTPQPVTPTYQQQSQQRPTSTVGTQRQ